MMQFIYPIGATPLDRDEVEGLIPSHIATQAELNEWEQTNIVNAESWVFSAKKTNVLTINFAQQLHKKMFDKTWRWAGKFRNTNKNIGVFWEQIAIKLKELVDDVGYQILNNTYSFDEIATRFHHRLVAIHPFPNGNGRHARLMVDVLLTAYNQPRFTWGSKNFNNKADARISYIEALRKADRYIYEPLLAFVRS